MPKKIVLLACFILFIGTDAFSAIYFTPRLTLREEYTDNLDLTPDNQRSDWITTISPGALIEFRERAYGVFLNYEPTYAKYSSYSENDTWRHQGTVGLWANLSQHTLFELENVSLYTEEPLPEINDELRRYRRRYSRYFRYQRNEQRDRYLSSITSTHLNYAFGPQDSFDLGYAYEILNLENDSESEYDPASSEGIQDTQRHEPYIVLNYWPQANEWGTETTARYRKGIFVESDDFDYWSAGLRVIKRFAPHFDGFLRYTYSTTEYDGTTESYQTHEGGPGISYAIDENTGMSVELTTGFQDREVSDDLYYFTLTSEIYKRWIYPRTNIELIASSGTDSNSFGSAAMGFNLFFELEGSIEYRLTRKMQWDIFGSGRYDKFVDTDPDRVDNVFRAGSGVSYQALSWLGLRCEYAHRRALSTIYEYEYAENRATFLITLMESRGRQPSNAFERGASGQTDRRSSETEENDSEIYNRSNTGRSTGN